MSGVAGVRTSSSSVPRTGGIVRTSAGRVGNEPSNALRASQHVSGSEHWASRRTPAVPLSPDEGSGHEFAAAGIGVKRQRSVNRAGSE
jgi:hypothetical protein